GNTIYAGSGTDTIFGDCGNNYGEFHNGLNADGTHASVGNTIFAGAGNATIYGDCYANDGTFYIDSSSDYLANVINGGDGCASLSIYGNCGYNYSSGTFHGGGNELSANFGQDTIYGDCGTNDSHSQFYGGRNAIYAGRSGSTATIYGDCYENDGLFSSSGNYIPNGHESRRLHP